MMNQYLQHDGLHYFVTGKSKYDQNKASLVELMVAERREKTEMCKFKSRVRAAGQQSGDDLRSMEPGAGMKQGYFRLSEVEITIKHRQTGEGGEQRSWGSLIARP